MLWHDLIKAVRRWFEKTNGLILLELDILPSKLASGTLYVVRKGACVRAIAMQCPCGCGEDIHINAPNAHPGFTVMHHSDGTVSLHPTIRRHKGCRSQFFVRRSRVYWWNIATGDACPSTETDARWRTSSDPDRGAHSL